MGIPKSQRSALTEFLENKSKSHVRLGEKSKSRSQKVGAKILCVGQIRGIKTNLFIRMTLYSVSGSPNDPSTKLSSQILI